MATSVVRDEEGRVVGFAKIVRDITERREKRALQESHEALARLKPAWIIPSALLFAAFRTGSNGLQASTGISATVGEVLVTVLVVLLLAVGVIRLSYSEASQ